MKGILIRTLILFTVIFSYIIENNLLAQTKATLQDVRKGNSLFEKGKYKEAEIEYRKAMDKSPDYQKAKFNIGTTLYKQGRFEDAHKIFSELTPPDKDKKMASTYWYNVGNSLLSQKKYQESMDAFKNSLKLNPKDEDCRYNYEYARRKMIQQQQQQQQQNQQQQQEEKKQQQQQKNQDKKEDKKQNKQQQQQQQEKKNLERQLDALNNNEKNTMKKLQKDKTGNKSKFEKDW